MSRYRLLMNCLRSESILRTAAELLSDVGRLASMTKTLHFKSALIASLLLIAMFGLSDAAEAQQPTQAQANAVRQSCRSDYQSYCASVPTGGTAALECLQKNVTSLSPACEKAVSATMPGSTQSQSSGSQPRSSAPTMPPREEAALMRRACGPDFRTLCRGVPLGGGRAIACLADHQESLSPSCRDALTAARSAR